MGWRDWVRTVEIEPSLYAADFWRLGEQVQSLLHAGARIFHVDHQMAVDPAAEVVDARSDRSQHDRADRHRRDEMPVADVEVEDAGAGLRDVLDLLTEPPEVRRVERRLDLDRPHPVAPRHGPILCA